MRSDTSAIPDGIAFLFLAMLDLEPGVACLMGLADRRKTGWQIEKPSVQLIALRDTFDADADVACIAESSPAAPPTILNGSPVFMHARF